MLENLLWHWNDSGRPFVVCNGGNQETGGGDPVPAWLKDTHCVGDGFCQCNLVGVELLGNPLNINGQGWHHPGMLYANSDAVWHKFPQLFKCNCQYSRIKTHYPRSDCNKHAMDARIATSFARSVVSMFADMPRDDAQLVPMKFRRVDARERTHLSKEEIFRMTESSDRFESASIRVSQFLRECRALRAKQRPPPKRVLWENRPRWNGGIIDLT